MFNCSTSQSHEVQAIRLAVGSDIIGYAIYDITHREYIPAQSCTLKLQSAYKSELKGIHIL